MPERDYVWLPRESILSFEEINRLVEIFLGLGVEKVRLTGGEPLLRHDLPTLIAQLHRHDRLRDIALTTNGILLARYADELRRAGLDRVTISLDTLRPDRMLEFARSGRHADVLEGIGAALRAELTPIKLNVVVIRGYNDDELVELIEFARRNQAEVRFIEYMDVGGATEWSMDQVVGRGEILERVGRHYGPVAAVPRNDWAPAEQFQLKDGSSFGVVASTTAPFCRTCDRSRLTADGSWLLCLYGENGLDLREALRSGCSDAAIAALIADAWSSRVDRGAELRAESPDRGALYQLESLQADPHREMHTRGG
jgi:cyclic pyranopterin phosphate synthase